MKAENQNRKTAALTAASFNSYIGVDVSKDTLDVCFTGPDGVALPGAEMRIRNDARGIRKLTGLIPAGSLTVMESTGTCHVKLSRALSAAGLDHSVLNPVWVKRFIQSTGEKAKNDRIDARRLAGYAYVFRPAPLVRKTEEREKLNALVTRRNQLVGMRTAEKNRYSSATDEEMKRSIKSIVKVLDDEIKVLDKKMNELIRKSDETGYIDRILRSMPGIGPVVSATLISCMPELGRIGSSPAVSLAGLAPFDRDSGQFRGKRFIGGGRATVRRALYMAAVSAISSNPVIREFYARLKAKGKSSKTALVACMRKMLVILSSMLRYEKMWNEHSIVHS